MSSSEFPEARTATGAVRGRFEGELAVFRGIPYAQPPVGDGRFAAPRPPLAWDGVREAFSFGPPPPQEPFAPGTEGPTSGAGGDDWLTVNVWTPEASSQAGLPVMVWMYGGAYKMGTAGDPGYDGSRLATDGNLVVVTLNYRVGVDGFLHIEGAPGNRGLLDQIAALEWVQANIRSFGGDPGRVTVFGESAGAGSIAALMSTPRTDGLFQRAIAQSVPGTYFSAALAYDIGATLAAEVGVRPTAAELAALAPEKLAEASAGLSLRMREYVPRWGSVALTPTLYSPVLDGDLLTTTPWAALSTGAARDVELITGHNRDEWRLFTLVSGLLGRVDDTLAAELLTAFGPGTDPEATYREAFPDATAEQLFEYVQSDYLFRIPTLRLAEAHIAGGGRAHLYELGWNSPVNGGVLGACHGLDVPLTFGAYVGGLGSLLVSPEHAEAAEPLSAQFRTAWTQFATTGDPGWPAYDPERRLTRLFDTGPAVAPYPRETSRLLWAEHEFTPASLRS